MTPPAGFKRVSRRRSGLLPVLSSILTFQVCLCLLPVTRLLSRESMIEGAGPRLEATRVFLDVPFNYQNYIKTEISFVNYVRDRKQSQVHVLLTEQATGSGGREFTVTFIGEHEFAGVNDTLRYTSDQLETEEVIMRGVVRTVKLGLIRYVSRTPLADDIVIEYRESPAPASAEDRWNNWVFNIQANGNIGGEEKMSSFAVFGYISADRVTSELKASIHASTNYYENNFDMNGLDISSISRSHQFQGLVVKSLGRHFSVGIYGSASSSTYSNLKSLVEGAPAVEYNVFPYEESTRREFRFLYRLGYTAVHYHEETIFDEIYENLLQENLSAVLEIKEKWGSARSGLEGSHYFKDLRKNRLQFTAGLTLRLLEGLSLTLGGAVSRIHDQLSLPKQGASETEILLYRKQLATQYDYAFSIGFRYTFGSIYSNVVNPRFGT